MGTFLKSEKICASMGSLQSNETALPAVFFFNPRLKIRLNEILKENKDFKSTSSLMERKVDELTEQNGLLSSQVLIHANSPVLSTFISELLSFKKNA